MKQMERTAVFGGEGRRVAVGNWQAKKLLKACVPPVADSMKLDSSFKKKLSQILNAFACDF